MQKPNFKNIIIISKQSAYKLYFMDNNVSRGRKFSGIMKKNRARFKKAHDAHYETLAIISKYFKENGINYVIANRGSHYDLKPYDLIISVGGDGTFLEAARRIKKQLLIGINSAPGISVGRFCLPTTASIVYSLKKIIFGKFSIGKLHRLDYRINNQPKVEVLNEILVAHHNPAYLCRYDIKIGNHQEEQRSSGLWIATAAGSSGAIRSAGGKLQNLYSKGIQYKVREIYKGLKIKHKLTGGIVTSRSKIVITSLMRKGMIYTDGPHHRLPFDYGAQLTVSISKRPLKVIKNFIH